LKAETQRDLCTPVLIAILLTTDERQKQPRAKCPSRDERIIKLAYPYSWGFKKSARKKIG
jgi:hypothetical protein